MQIKHLKIIAVAMAISTLLITNPLAIFSQTAELPPIIITEIAAFEPSDTEWVEIYNRSGTTTDMTGWKFFEDETNHGLSVFYGNAAIGPNEYAIIANKADAVAQKYPQYAGTIFDSSWDSLKEDGEEIGLKNASGEFVERFNYGDLSQTAVAEKEASIERADANIPAAEPTNWTRSETSNSIGAARSANSTVPAVDNTATTTAAAPEYLPVDNSEPAPETANTTTEPTVDASSQPAPAGNTTLPNLPQPTAENAANVPQNLPPQAIIQIQSGSLIAEGNTTINFDGGSSFDPEREPLTFIWDMGDGNTENTANPRPHKYSKPGTYIVALTVTDPSGAQSTAQQYVQVSAAQTTTQPAVSANNHAQGTTSEANASAKKTAAKQPSTSALKIQKVQNGLFEVHGYLAFEPSAAKELQKILKQQANAEKTAASTKKSTKKTPASAKTAKKTTKKKQTPKNGDLSAAIKITELFPSPSEGDEEEWIEIFNSGKTAVNLGNWMLADIAKKNSPYKIADTAAIAAGAYMVFPKSETKISLNNGSDKIFLADFNGKIADSISYENAKKDYSYALVNVAEPEANLVASAQKIAARQRSANEWTWLPEPTPEKSNPAFEKLEGAVSRLLAGGADGNNSFDVTFKNGASKTIRFSEDTLNPLLAETVLTPGSTVSLKAQKQKNGSYDLQKIEGVRPIAQQEQQKKQSSAGWEKNPVFWMIIGVIAASVALNLPMLVRALKEKIKGNRENS